jgi:hypothetical protein
VSYLFDGPPSAAKPRTSDHSVHPSTQPPKVLRSEPAVPTTDATDCAEDHRC